MRAEMNTKRSMCAAAVSAALAWAATGSAVWAADTATQTNANAAAEKTAAEKKADKDKKDEIEVITVTATRSPTSLIDTPVAVTALNQETLTRQGVKDLRDISGLIPNVQLGLSPGDSGVQAAVRGVTSTNFTEIGDPAVGIHVDGLYSPRPQGSLALLFDLDQLEALRGPQGTLFGRNSTGGTINVIPARPDLGENYGNVQVGYGNYNHQQLRGVLNVGVSERVALRATFMSDTRDGYIDQKRDLTDRHVPELGYVADGIPDVDQRYNRVIGKDEYYTNSDQWAARLSLKVAMTDRVEWLLAYEHWQNDSAGDILLKDCAQAAGTRYACQGSHWQALINVPGEMDMSITSWRSTLTWNVDDHRVLEYRLGHARQQRYQQHDDDAGLHWLDAQVSVDVRPGMLPDWGNWGLWHVDDRATWTLDSDYVSLVHDLQWREQHDNFRYVAGLFWMHEDNQIDFAQEQLVTSPMGLPSAQYYRQPDRQIDAKALFAQADWTFADNWTLTLGARYSRDEKTDRNGQTYGNWNTSTPWYFNGHFDPGLPSSPGWRLHNSNDLTGQMGPFVGPQIYPGPTINEHAAEWSKTTWRAGLMYEIDERSMVFTSVSTGYKAGGFGDKFDICGGRPCADGSPSPNYSFLDYEPETVTNYELGYKGRSDDGKLLVSAVLFYSIYEDQQVTGMHAVGQRIPDGPCPDWEPQCDIVNAWKTENVAESVMRGIELEFDYIPWADGRVSGYFSWLDTEVQSYPTFSDGHFCGYRDEFGHEPCPGLYDGPDPDKRGRAIYDVTGNQLPYSPEFSAALNYEHDLDLGDGYTLVPWVSVRWQDKMYFTVRNFDSAHISDAQPAYTQVNASVRLLSPDRNWELEAYGNNLTDEIVKNWFDQSNGFPVGSYNPPRMYGLRFTYFF